MNTSILRPFVAGDYDALTIGAGASKPAAVDTGDPISHDELTTYLKNTAASQKQSFTLTGLPPNGVSVIAVRMGIRQRTEAGNVAGTTFARLNNTDGSAASSWGVDFAFTTDLDTLPRPGGGSWTIDDILGDLEMVVSVGGSGTDIVSITSMWLEVDWDTPGGFAFLL